jgi:hypothetical protein
MGGNRMPTYVLDLIKQLGFFTPFVYAAATFWFFHYLDKQASAQAKKAISGWFKPLQYDRAAVAAAIVELFDRLYTRPLLGWRAVLRSAVFTLVVTGIFLFEFISGQSEFHLVIRIDEGGVLRTQVDQIIATNYAGTLLTNTISDYISLFIVRRYLMVGENRPLIALVSGPLFGMSVVVIFVFVRNFGLLLWLDPHDVQAHMSRALEGIINKDVLLLSLPALAVHLWLPLFGFGLLCVNGLNYLMRVIGGMQWFLKRGREHPLDAVGYVLGFLVFVGTGILQLVR